MSWQALKADGGLGDERVLRELAALNGAAVPARPALSGEVQGHPWAAISLYYRHVVADPFRPNVPLAAILAYVRGSSHRLSNTPLERAS